MIDCKNSYLIVEAKSGYLYLLEKIFLTKSVATAINL